MACLLPDHESQRRGEEQQEAGPVIISVLQVYSVPDLRQETNTYQSLVNIKNWILVLKYCTKILREWKANTSLLSEDRGKKDKT